MPGLDQLVWFSIAAMAALVVGQGVFVLLWYRQMARRPAAPFEAGLSPEPAAHGGAAAVVLCVRGPDPSLSECLAALDRLSWPDYEVFIGLDSPDDPAWPIVEEHRSRASRACHIHILRNFPGTCSPKCALLAEIVEQLPARFSIVALVDADCIVAPDWLELLARPLADYRTGAVSGTRWFEPPDRMACPFGTTVRNIWNAAAIVQMHLYGIAWGGSLAFRRETLISCGFPDTWRTQLCEDTCVSPVLARNGLRLVRPPALVVINEESAPLAAVPEWIARQLLTVRLYNPRWPLVALHGLMVGTLSAFVISLAAVALFAGQFAVAGLAAAGFAAYTLMSWMLLFPVSRCCYSALESHRLPHSRPSILRDWHWWLISIPATQFIHWLAMARVFFGQIWSWRQVQYRISGRKLAVEKMEPFSGPAVLAGHSVH